MRGRKVDRQAKRLRRRQSCQRLDRLVADAGGPVRRFAGAEIVPLVGMNFGDVVRVGSVVAHAQVADQSGLIAGGVEQGGIGLRPGGRRQRLIEVFDAVPPGVLTRQDASPADAADRRGHEMIAKAAALGRQPVDGGRLDDWVAGGSEAVVAHVVGQEEDDVGPRGRIGRGSRRSARQHESQRHPEGRRSPAHQRLLSYWAVTRVVMPPRGVKAATSVIRRGRTTATRSSRIRLVTCS